MGGGIIVISYTFKSIIIKIRRKMSLAYRLNRYCDKIGSPNSFNRRKLLAAKDKSAAPVSGDVSLDKRFKEYFRISTSLSTASLPYKTTFRIFTAYIFWVISYYLKWYFQRDTICRYTFGYSSFKNWKTLSFFCLRRKLLFMRWRQELRNRRAAKGEGARSSSISRSSIIRSIVWDSDVEVVSRWSHDSKSFQLIKVLSVGLSDASDTSLSNCR